MPYLIANFFDQASAMSAQAKLESRGLAHALARHTAKPSTGHPEALGHVRLLVNLDGDANGDELTRMLTELGGQDISRSDEAFPEGGPGTWPWAAQDANGDVQRAVEASREGAAAGAPPKEDINRPSMKTRHDPQR